MITDEFDWMKYNQMRNSLKAAAFLKSDAGMKITNEIEKAWKAFGIEWEQKIRDDQQVAERLNTIFKDRDRIAAVPRPWDAKQPKLFQLPDRNGVANKPEDAGRMLKVRPELAERYVYRCHEAQAQGAVPELVDRPDIVKDRDGFSREMADQLEGWREANAHRKFIRGIAVKFSKWAQSAFVPLEVEYEPGIIRFMYGAGPVSYHETAYLEDQLEAIVHAAGGWMYGAGQLTGCSEVLVGVAMTRSAFEKRYLNVQM